MSSGTEWPATTVQYRLNLPRILHPISPHLAALHASRAVALHPEISAVLQPSHCPKCGTYYFSGDHPTCLVSPSARKKRQRRATSPRSRALQRKCHACGFLNDAEAARINPSILSSTSVQLPNDSSTQENVSIISQKDEMDQESPPIDVPRSVVGSGPTMTSPPVLGLPVRQSRLKSNNTKTSALRDMISRDRQREEVVKAQQKKKEGHEGLAAFLKEL